MTVRERLFIRRAALQAERIRDEILTKKGTDNQQYHYWDGKFTALIQIVQQVDGRYLNKVSEI